MARRPPVQAGAKYRHPHGRSDGENRSTQITLQERSGYGGAPDPTAHPTYLLAVFHSVAVKRPGEAAVLAVPVPLHQELDTGRTKFLCTPPRRKYET